MKIRLIALVVFAAAAGVLPAAEPLDPARFAAAVAELTKASHRLAGTPEGAAAGAFLERELRALKGEVLVQRFTFPQQRVIACYAEFDGKRLPLFPLKPNGLQASVTPAAGIEGAAVSVGAGAPADFNGRDCRGAVVLADFGAVGALERAFRYGAGAIIYLGAEDDDRACLRDKRSYASVDLPRFWIPRTTAAREGLLAAKRIRVVSAIEWIHAEGRNLFLWIPGTAPTFASKGEGEYLILSSSYDSDGPVFLQSPDCETAANCAALLEIARRWSAAPPRRSTLIAFFDNRANFMEGGRQFYAAFRRAFPSLIKDPLPARGTFLTQERETLHGLLQVLRAPDPLRAEGEFAERIHDMLRDAARGRHGDLQLDLIALRLDRERGRQTGPSDGAEADPRIESLLAQSRDLLRTREAIRDRQLPPETERKGFDLVRDEVRDRLQRRLGELDVLQKAQDDAVALARRVQGSHPTLHVALRFTAGNRTWLAVPSKNSTHEKLYADFSEAAQRLTAGTAPNAIWPRESASEYVNSPSTAESLFAEVFEIPSLTLTTALDRAPKMGMPLAARDAERLDSIRQQASEAAAALDLLANAPWASVPNRVLTVSQSALCLEDYLWNDAKAEPEGHMVKSYTFGQNTPNRPEPGALVHFVLNDVIAGLHNQVAVAGRALDAKFTELHDYYTWTDGNGCFPWTAIHSAYGRRAFVEAARFDSDGRIARITVANPRGGAGRVSSRWEKAGFYLPRARFESYAILAMFPAASSRFIGRTLPFGESFLPSSFALYNGLTDSAYRREHFRYDPLVGIGAGYVEKPLGVKVIYQDPFHRENVALLVNCPPGSAKGLGFAPGNGEPPGPQPPTLDLYARPAQDFVNLNETRLHRLRRHNIILNALETLHARATRALERAQAAAEALRHPEADRDAALVSAIERRVYHPVIATTNDMVVAVTVLLVLAIPFSLGLQSLLFATYNVYRKIAAFALVFAATFLVLYFVHPAFAFAATPMIIILAFVIMMMSGGVIWIIGDKFVYEVNKLQGLATAAHALRRGAIGNLGAALSLAISTMRRRPVRTILTTATVLLLTFTILSFVSVQTEEGINRYAIGVSDSFTRLLVHRKVWRSMDPNVLEETRGLVGARGDVHGRWWLTEEMDVGVSTQAESSFGALVIPVQHASGALAQAGGLLSLDPREIEALPALRACLPGRIEEFNAGKGAWFPPNLLAQLGAKTGDRVRVRGVDLIVLGAFDPAKLAALRDVDGARLLPVNFVATQQAMRFTSKGSAGLDATDSAADQQSDLEDALARLEPQALEVVNPESLLLVPPQRHAELGMSLKGLNVYPASGADSETLARDLALVNEAGAWLNQGGEVTHFFYGTQYGVSGASEVLIPLLLGGLIIFSTMLGSVIDREKEIYTFSALGLAPRTIAALFFVEAGIYAVIGGFGGYLLSQVVTRLLETLAAWGFFRAPEMNYSSTTAISTILLMMATVMVSTIYPALQAARKATADTRRTWRPPRPEGDTCRFEFPFTISRHDVGGILAFIREHFASHADRTVGKFAADAPQVFRETAHAMPGLRATIWLQPFDQGISQGFELTARPSDIEGVCEIHVELTRRSGPPSAWERAYRVFLGEMRLQFLLWRTLPDETREHYLAEAEALDATLPAASPIA